MAATKKKKKDALDTYNAKRRFDETPEPKGKIARKGSRLYTIQKHDATRLHYDFRLELDGVLLSWAVTRGPSLNPADKRLAVRTEDHPVDYAEFEGTIPEGNYGAGTVLLWDKGTWTPHGDPHEGLKKGKLVFDLDGERLKGRWGLIRMRAKEGEKRENWLLIKELDDLADRESDVTAENVTSVASGRDLEEIADAPEALWTRRGRQKAPKRKSPKVGPLPKFVEPQLATLVDDVPKGDDWIFEVKFDGYRALAAVSGDQVKIYTRNGLDWTGRFKTVARALAKLGLDGAFLDGEVVAIDEHGHADFGALQNALNNNAALSYFVFDLLELEGKDLRRRSLTERKELLRRLLGDAGRKGPVFFVDHVEQAGSGMLASICDKGFEGIIGKRGNAPYRSGRAKSWLKIKCGHEQEFVILGWSDSTKDRPFSSLMLGLREDGGFRYAGRIGSGFSERDLQTLSKRFQNLRKKPDLADVPRSVERKAHWVKPELVAEVAFAGFTKDGLVRQGRFLGLREDKSAKNVRREKAVPVEKIR